MMKASIRHIQRRVKDASWIVGLPCASLTSRAGDGKTVAEGRVCSHAPAVAD